MLIDVDFMLRPAFICPAGADLPPGKMGLATGEGIADFI
jgi:hypothetical protein